MPIPLEKDVAERVDQLSFFRELHPDLRALIESDNLPALDHRYDEITRQLSIGVRCALEAAETINGIPYYAVRQIVWRRMQQLIRAQADTAVCAAAE